MLGDELEEIESLVDEVLKESPEKESDQNWLIEITEKFCQERALHNAILESIHILDEKNKNNTKGKGEIPKILSDALAISFDPNIGHDYIEDADDRFDFYHLSEKRIPFDLDYFNRITKGGIPSKTLTIALAGTGVGKSLFMCHVAGACLMQNYNVLYITLEMSEEKIAERIDANLMNIPISDLETIPRDNFERRIKRLQDTVKGRLIIKEYPTASGSAIHFRNLLTELAMKKKFKPDIVFIDYINICASSRIKLGSAVNSYSLIKAIAEELRGLAVEFDVPIISATQLTRSGYTNTDPGLEDTAESFGLPATADLMFALISNEEMDKANQIMVKQLKNRYNDVVKNRKFTVGIDRTRMKLYDVDQDGYIADSGQAFDQPAPFKSSVTTSKFKGLKV